MTTKEEALEVLNNLDPEVYVEVLKQRWEDDFYHKSFDELKHYRSYLEYLGELENFYHNARNKLEELRTETRDRDNHTAYAELVIALRDLTNIETHAVVEAQERLSRRLNDG